MAINVTAAWDKASYNAGETMRATIAGQDVDTTTETTTSMVGPVAIPVVSPDGETATVDVPAVQVTTTRQIVTTESVVIDTAAFNPNQAGRTWTVSPDKLSITATAS